MERRLNTSYPGPVFRPSLSISPQSQSARLQTSPNADMIDWFRAVLDPSYDLKNNASQNLDQYVRTLQDGEHWAMIGGEQVLRRYFAQGSWESGDITITFDEATTPLSIHDWVIPKGNGSAPAELPDARTLTAKEVYVRGENTVLLSGTVSSSVTNITGTGTSFLTDFHAGDILSVLRSQYIVESIQDDAHLTLVSGPQTDWTNIAYAKGLDLLLYRPVTRIQHIQDAVRTYTSGVDFAVAVDAGGINWINPYNCPLPGTRCSVIYDYLPCYLITDLGSKDQIVKGIPGLSVVMAKLVKPDTLKR